MFHSPHTLRYPNVPSQVPWVPITHAWNCFQLSHNPLSSGHVFCLRSQRSSVQETCWDCASHFLKELSSWQSTNKLLFQNTARGGDWSEVSFVVVSSLLPSPKLLKFSLFFFHKIKLLLYFILECKTDGLHAMWIWGNSDIPFPIARTVPKPKGEMVSLWTILVDAMLLCKKKHTQNPIKQLKSN